MTLHIELPETIARQARDLAAREHITVDSLIFAHQLHDSIGRCVLDLELIAKVTDAVDWVGKTDRLPLR